MKQFKMNTEIFPILNASMYRTELGEFDYGKYVGEYIDIILHEAYNSINKMLEKLNFDAFTTCFKFSAQNPYNAKDALITFDLNIADSAVAAIKSLEYTDLLLDSMDVTREEYTALLNNELEKAVAKFLMFLLSVEINFDTYQDEFVSNVINKANIVCKKKAS